GVAHHGRGRPRQALRPLRPARARRLSRAPAFPRILAQKAFAPKGAKAFAWVAPAGASDSSALMDAEIDVGAVAHDHEGVLGEGETASAIVLDDLELTHPVAHRPHRIVVGLEGVGARARFPRDGETLGAVASGDVGVQLAAGAETTIAVVGMAAAPIVDVEVDIVGVGLP